VVVVVVLTVETPLTVGGVVGRGEAVGLGVEVGVGSADAKAMADEEGEELILDMSPVVKRKTK